MRLSKEWVFVLIASFFVFVATAIAEQKYNPYTGDWETVSPDSEIQYNTHSGQWGYSPPDSSPKYNPHENTWDMAPDNYQQIQSIRKQMGNNKSRFTTTV